MPLKYERTTRFNLDGHVTSRSDRAEREAGIVMRQNYLSSKILLLASFEGIVPFLPVD